MNATTATFAHPRFPMIDLLNPRKYTRLALLMLAGALIAAGGAMRWLGTPLWAATMLSLALMLPIGVLKWRIDGQRYGPVAMVLCILVIAQGFHSLEHLAQWIQYHILRWPSFVSSGLISTLNAETVHFIWNWGVFFTIAYLVRGGMRGFWGWALMAWITAHALEHTYLMARYVLVLQDLRALGAFDVGAQGLPGILGRDGWLATSPATQGTFICRLPGVTTAVRLDVHFWWNFTETLLLQLAGHFYLRQFVTDRAARPQQPALKPTAA
jgi:hypothetical protein